MHRLHPLLGFLVFFAAAVSGAEPKTISVAYSGNTLSFSVPYESVRSGEAQLSLEVLSPEDRVLGQRPDRTRY